MNEVIKLRKILSVLLLFFLPINQKISTILIVATFFLTLIDYKNINIERLKNNWSLPFFFLMYVVMGSLIREDFLLKHIEYKLSFIAMPLIFHNYALKDYMVFFKSYVIGLISFYFILWLNVFYNTFDLELYSFSYKVHDNDYNFMDNGIKGGNYFLGEYFTGHLQPIYFSIYYCLGLLLLHQLKIFRSKLTIRIISFLFILAIIQSFSKSGIILLFIVIIFLIFQNIKFKNWILIATIPLFIGLVYKVNTRIGYFIDDVIGNGFHLKKNSTSSVDMRLLIWDASLQSIKKEPIIGYGIVEGQYELNRAYVENEYKFPLFYRLNAHNLYLQTAIEGGLVLLFVFILIQFNLVFEYKDKALVLGFTILCFFSFMIESYFSRYLGVSFFTLFYTLIFNYYERENQ